MANGVAGKPAPGADDSLEKIKAENQRSFEQTMALNMINKEGDRQKEGAAAVGNSQKSAHDALMQLIANLK